MFLQKIIIIIDLIDPSNAKLLDARPTDINKFDDALINDLFVGQITPNLFYIFIDGILPNSCDCLCWKHSLLLLHLLCSLKELINAILKRVIFYLKNQVIPFLYRNKPILAQYPNDSA